MASTHRHGQHEWSWPTLTIIANTPCHGQHEWSWLALTIMNNLEASKHRLTFALLADPRVAFPLGHTLPSQNLSAVLLQPHETELEARSVICVLLNNMTSYDPNLSQQT